MSTVRIINADVMDGLAQLEDESVNCVVTSPPYWGLRDYGVDGQIGLETAPAEYVQKLVEVFREVRRVLRSDGVLWVNIGDSYTDSGRGEDTGSGLEGSRQSQAECRKVKVRELARQNCLRPKNLMGFPWRVALALQDDGWNLRSDTIWRKTNGMPEQVKDRPSKCHEYIFLFSKSRRYYYNWEAIATRTLRESKRRAKRAHKANTKRAASSSMRAQSIDRGNGPMKVNDLCNARSVWDMPVARFSGDHFAVFPEVLPARCIAVGCPPGGMVLDPFGGSGTTGIAAAKRGVNAILIELNPATAKMAEEEIAKSVPMMAQVRVESLQT